jgi:hypothetical protein
MSGSDDSGESDGVTMIGTYDDKFEKAGFAAPF